MLLQKARENDGTGGACIMALREWSGRHTRADDERYPYAYAGAMMIAQLWRTQTAPKGSE